MALTPSRLKSKLTSSQQYESLAKWVLNKRLWTLSLYTSSAILFFTSLLAIVTQRGISFSALIVVPLFSALMCCASIMPLVIIRRLNIQPTAPSAPPSYSALISSLIKSPASWRALFVYAASGSAFALLNALCAASLGAHDWHLFSPTKRHTTNLNEWVIYLMVGNFCVGAALAFKDLIQARWIVKWPPRVSLRPHVVFERSYLALQLRGPMFLAGSTAVLYSVGYWWFRKLIYRNLMRLPVLGILIKPLVFHAARPSASLPLTGTLFPRLLALAIVTAIHFEHTEAFFDALCGTGMLVTKESPDPDACLFSGLACTDPYYKHFAYLELAHIARKGPMERRSAIFNDGNRKIAGMGNAWQVISQECFRIMGEDYGLLKRRGNPAPPPPASAPPAPPSKQPSTPRKTTIDAPIYKPVVPPSPGALFVRSLLSVSSMAPPPSTSERTPPAGITNPSDALQSPMKSVSMPRIFLAKESEEKANGHATQNAAPAASPNTSLIQAFFGGITSAVSGTLKLLTARAASGGATKEAKEGTGEPFVVLPSVVKGWRGDLARNRAVFLAEASLPHREMDRLCVQILAWFTVASLKEDSYGTLQRDIPKVLEAMARMLIAIEQYATELQAAHDPSTLEFREAEEAVEQVLRPLRDDIINGLTEIIVTFGDRLNVFRLPIPVARRLQTMVDVM